VNDTTHIHDFNPGFGPAVSSVDSGNGFGTRVFWTAVIPDADVQVNPGAGRAELHVRDLAVLDYFAPGGLAGNVSLGPQWQTAAVDATVSFDVVWGGPITRRVSINDAIDGFAGQFNENQATVSWSASSSSGFTFISNPGNFSTSVPEVPGVNGVTAPLNFFAEIAKEQNGIFFPAGSQRIGTATTNDASLTVPTEQAAVGITALDLVHALLAAAPTTAVPVPVSEANHAGERPAGTSLNPHRPTQYGAPADLLGGGAALAEQHDQAFAGGFTDAFSTPEGYLWAV
jgi:hypothetical protein